MPTATKRRRASASEPSAQATEQATAQQVEMIPLDLIDRAPDNPRQSVDLDQARALLEQHRANPKTASDDAREWAEMVASIQAQGVLQPVTVVQRAERYMLVMGDRRTTAARLAGVPAIPAIVREMGEAERLAAMAIENLLRKDLDPLEEARAFRNLQNLKYSTRRIAEAVGVSQPTIAKRLALLKLPESVQAHVAARHITVREAEALARLIDHPDRLEQVLKDIMDAKPSGGMKESALTARIEVEMQAIRRDAERAKRRDAALKQAEADGVAVVEWPSDPVGWDAQTARPIAGQEHGRCVHADAVLADEQAERTSHHEQRCHAATICPHGDLVMLCTDPSRHDPTPAETPEETSGDDSDREDEGAPAIGPTGGNDDGIQDDTTEGQPVEGETEEQRAAREAADTEARRLREEAEATARKEAAEREAAQAAWQAHQQALAEAGQGRDAHIRAHLDQAKVSKAELLNLLGFMVDQWSWHVTPEYRGEMWDLLGIQSPSDDADADDRSGRFAAWVAEDPNRAIKAGKAMALVAGESALASRPYWAGREIRRHYAWLEAHGYEPNQAERAELEGEAPRAPR